MWRFYVAATLLVAVFVFAVTLHRFPSADLRISARASGTPSAPRSQGAESAAGAGVRGDAVWALSALPDCARQDSEARGPAARVRALIPADAQSVEGRLAAGPCAIDVTSGGIFVARGDVRLRIPPPARLLRRGDRYYLYTQDRNAGLLRVYRFAK
jgi:hypothetical protein